MPSLMMLIQTLFLGYILTKCRYLTNESWCCEKDIVLIACQQKFSICSIDVKMKTEQKMQLKLPISSSTTSNNSSNFEINEPFVQI